MHKTSKNRLNSIVFNGMNHHIQLVSNDIGSLIQDLVVVLFISLVSAIDIERTQKNTKNNKTTAFKYFWLRLHKKERKRVSHRYAITVVYHVTQSLMRI